MGKNLEVAILVIASCFALTGPVIAQEMPRYDPTDYCRNVSDVSGGSSSIYKSCMEMEQDAYDKQKAQWASLDIKSREYCDQVARVAGGSYSILDSCIGMEADASASTPEFKF